MTAESDAQGVLWSNQALENLANNMHLSKEKKFAVYERLKVVHDEMQARIHQLEQQLADLAQHDGATGVGENELIAIANDLLHLTYTADHAWDDSDYALRDRIVARIIELEQEPAAAPVPTPLVIVPDGPLGKLGTILRNRTIFIPCSMCEGILHGYTLADGEFLVRQRRQGSEGANE